MNVQGTLIGVVSHALPAQVKDIGVLLPTSANVPKDLHGMEMPVKLLAKTDKFPLMVNASVRKTLTGQVSTVLLVELAKCGMDLPVWISSVLLGLSGTVLDATQETNALKTIITMELLAAQLQLPVLQEQYGKMEIVHLLETTVKMDSIY